MCIHTYDSWRSAVRTSTLVKHKDHYDHCRFSHQMWDSPHHLLILLAEVRLFWGRVLPCSLHCFCTCSEPSVSSSCMLRFWRVLQCPSSSPQAFQWKLKFHLCKTELMPLLNCCILFFVKTTSFNMPQTGSQTILLQLSEFIWFCKHFNEFCSLYSLTALLLFHALTYYTIVIVLLFN